MNNRQITIKTINSEKILAIILFIRCPINVSNMKNIEFLVYVAKEIKKRDNMNGVCLKSVNRSRDICGIKEGINTSYLYFKLFYEAYLKKWF